MKAAIKSILLGVVALLVVTTITFFLVRFAPGGPFDRDKPLPEVAKALLEKKFCLDRPVAEQFFSCFLPNAAKGDFGPSYTDFSRNVQDVLKEGLPVTAKVGGLALMVAIIIGLFFAIIASLNHATWLDNWITAGMTVGIVIPEFVIGPIFIYIFSTRLGIFDPRGLETPRQAVLPVATMGAYYIAVIYRYTRSGMLDVLREAYVLTAVAKGLSRWRIIVIHSLWAGLRPTFTYTGVAMAGIFGGSTIVIERMFDLPGIANQFVDAVTNRNYTMIQGTTILFGAMIITVNTVVEVIVKLVDPRTRRSS